MTSYHFSEKVAQVADPENICGRDKMLYDKLGTGQLPKTGEG